MSSFVLLFFWLLENCRLFCMSVQDLSKRRFAFVDVRDRVFLSTYEKGEGLSSIS